MLRSSVAMVLCAGLVSAGCGPDWPNRATIVGDRAFMAKAKTVGTVDVLPLDLELWTAAGYDANPEELRSAAETRILNTALAALADRNYSLTGILDWNGDVAGAMNAMPKHDLLATVGALAGYGELAKKMPGRLPIPFLPARLGETTHADATLFVGGWAFVGNHQESTANKIAQGVAIALVVVAVVAIVVVAASALGKGDHHHGHEHGGDGDHGGGGGRAVASSSGRGVVHLGGRLAAETAVDMIDAFGRTAAVAAQTDWSSDPELPREGDSQMYLEMTLIDNHTGLALWHVHQQFPANATAADDVDRVASTLLASLPAR